MSNKIMLVVRREYLERVSKKSFIFTTILLPVILIALAFIPALVMEMQTAEVRTLAVIDDSGVILSTLNPTETIKYAPTDMTVDQIKALPEDENQYDGILVIGRDVVTNPSDVKLYMYDAVPVEVEMTVTENINSSVENIRLKEFNIENLDKIMDQVRADATIQTIRIDGDQEQGSSSFLAMAIGIVMAFILYMMILMYGNMVMTSIIEEKNNRVLELVVSSVKPAHLMIGKIVGIGLVAVTQIAIWTVLLASVLGAALPAMLSPELTDQVALMQSGAFDATVSNYDADMVQVLASLSDISHILGIFFWVALFLIGGFLLFASMYAAIASSVDNIQDASQLSYLPTIPIIIAMVFTTAVASDPNSSLAVWLSMIPLTSPMVMVTRIPFGIPVWEIVVSLVILYASFILMVWIAGKIYRVGIFMHGKKPTIHDLIRWARYK